MASKKQKDQTAFLVCFYLTKSLSTKQSTLTGSKGGEHQLKVETTDLYHGAYLMAKGIALVSMTVFNSGGRSKIMFKFTGKKELVQVNKAFEQGQALVNPVDLKKSILHLKDMMYDKLKIRQQKERRFGNGHKKGRYRGC